MDSYDDILKEKDREKRFEEILVDCYDEYEQDSAFECYVTDYVTFPFNAKIRNKPDSEEFVVERIDSVKKGIIICDVKIEGNLSRMPLTEIEPVDKNSANWLVIDDYVEFVRRY